MLPESYKAALQALKDQASVAAAMLEAEDKAARKEARKKLAEVHSRISAHGPEARVIGRLLMTSKDESLTIDTLDEERLSQELGYAQRGDSANATKGSPNGSA
jgi:poly-gamma-glutamate capsule biosynthesis protein CapA/YwtB (metallophosphatase superfamily)